jgi:hypothetical protein
MVTKKSTRASINIMLRLEDDNAMARVCVCVRGLCVVSPLFDFRNTNRGCVGGGGVITGGKAQGSGSTEGATHVTTRREKRRVLACMTHKTRTGHHARVPVEDPKLRVCVPIESGGVGQHPPPGREFRDGM